MRSRGEIGLSYKVRWVDKKANGTAYQDSWVNEREIPNKLTLYDTLEFQHNAGDVVVHSWWTEIYARSRTVRWVDVEQ